MKIAIIGSASSVHIPRWVNALSAIGLEVHFLSVHPLREDLNPSVSF